MTEQELERALRKALPPLHPDPSLTDRIVSQIDSNPAQPADPRVANAPRRWLPAAMAAAALIAFGFAHWTQQQHQRQLQVRAQLLQGLTIASASLRDVRSAVLQSEDFAP